jgi:chromosome segregation ATPase
VRFGTLLSQSPNSLFPEPELPNPQLEASEKKIKLLDQEIREAFQIMKDRDTQIRTLKQQLQQAEGESSNALAHQLEESKAVLKKFKADMQSSMDDNFKLKKALEAKQAENKEWKAAAEMREQGLKSQVERVTEQLMQQEKLLHTESTKRSDMVFTTLLGMFKK